MAKKDSKRSAPRTKRSISSSIRGEDKSATSSPRGKSAKEAPKDIESFSREDIKRMKAARQTPQQKSKVPTLELDESFWQAAAFVHEKPKRKASIHLRIDQDILDHFRNEGPGHLTRMANILKAYVEATRSTR